MQPQLYVPLHKRKHDNMTKMISAKTMTVRFEKEKETKGTWRYAEVLGIGEVDLKIGMLYLRNATVDELGKPEELIVTVNAK